MIANDYITTDQFLKNAAILLSSAEEDAQKLQIYLTDILYQSASGGVSLTNLDLAVLQSLDRLTQVLRDLSVAFQASTSTPKDVNGLEWYSIAKNLKVEYVGLVLKQGLSPNKRDDEAEIF